MPFNIGIQLGKPGGLGRFIEKGAGERVARDAVQFLARQPERFLDRGIIVIDVAAKIGRVVRVDGYGKPPVQHGFQGMAGHAVHHGKPHVRQGAYQ